MMLSKVGFFHRDSDEFYKNNKNQEKTVIHVGGEIFRSLAVAFIDNVKQGITLPDSYLNILLEQLISYFPQKMPKSTMLASEFTPWLAKHPHKLDLIACLAYVLRQLTVDALIADPLRYKQAIFELPKQCSETSLRHHDTPFPVQALSALTTQLPITLSLSFKEPGKELRRQVNYASLPQAMSFKLDVQIQSNSYFPKVKDADYFAAVGSLTSNWVEPISLKQRSLIPLHDLIEADNMHLWKKYEQYRKTLHTLIEDGDLGKEKLQALYIEWLPPSNQQLFAFLEQRYKKNIALDIEGSLDEQKTQLLINALSGGLSLAQINEQQFFEALEQPTTRVSI